MNRRTFLQSSAALAALAPPVLDAAEKTAPKATAAGKPRGLKKGFMFSMLSSETAKKLSLKEKFQLLKEGGFDGVEVMSAMNQQEVLAARDATGLEIPSLIIATHWSHPLTSPNPSARETTVEGLKQGLRDAKAYGCSSVLLVPGVVNKDIVEAVTWDWVPEGGILTANKYDHAGLESYSSRTDATEDVIFTADDLKNLKKDQIGGIGVESEGSQLADVLLKQMGLSGNTMIVPNWAKEWGSDTA